MPILPSKSARKIKLWQLLLVIAAVSIALGLLPQHIGIPIFLVIEGILMVALLFFLVIAALQRLTNK